MSRAPLELTLSTFDSSSLFKSSYRAVDSTNVSKALRRLRELGKQSEDPSFLLIEGIKESNHVDESVCRLQDNSFQVSSGREDAVPVWVGMGWLATKSGEVPQSKH